MARPFKFHCYLGFACEFSARFLPLFMGTSRECERRTVVPAPPGAVCVPSVVVSFLVYCRRVSERIDPRPVAGDSEAGG